VIEARHLSKRFGRRDALFDITFQAAPGRVVGLLGPNGAGKSTTMRILAGLIPPTGGRASVAGFDTVAQSLEVRRRLGYLPETPPLYPEMRVASFLRFRGRLHGLRGAALRAAMDRAMQMCDLGDVAAQRVGQLSRGYRQRVGLGAALLHDPPVIMLDEPTSGLDPAQIVQIRRLIRELGRTRTVLFSSHILPEVETTCDEAVVIVRGRVAARGTLDELRALAAGGRRCVVEARSCDAAAILRALPGVRRLEAASAADGWTRLVVDAETPGAASEPSAALRQRVAEAIASAGGALRELRDEEASLERLYMSVLERGAPAAQTDEPAPEDAAA